MIPFLTFYSKFDLEVARGHFGENGEEKGHEEAGPGQTSWVLVGQRFGGHKGHSTEAVRERPAAVEVEVEVEAVGSDGSV